MAGLSDNCETKLREVWPELYDPDFPDNYEIVNITKESEPGNDCIALPFEYNDGGRLEAGFTGSNIRDCVARSISIVSGVPYMDVYSALADGNASQKATSRTPKRTKTAAKGIFTKRKWFQDYMRSLGFVWVSTQSFNSKKRTYLRKGALPPGRLVVAVSKHYTAVIDGVINDTHDCGRNGQRCVYGYWTKDS